MPEFKVGDRVRVKADCQCHAGEIGTVDELTGYGWMLVWLDKHRMVVAAFTHDELEPAPESQP